MSGAGSKLTGINTLEVATLTGSTASMLITSGGSVGSNLNVIEAANGSITVDGAGGGASLTSTGYLSATGAVSVKNGGTVVSTGASVINGGLITVTGTGSMWTNNAGSSAIFEVGGTTLPGQLKVLGGGTVTNATTTNYIGYSAAGTVIVDGAGSKLAFTGAATGICSIGFENAGTLNITNGGLVTSSAGTNTIGNYTTSATQGSVTVDGTGGAFNLDYDRRPLRWRVHYQ